MTEYKVYTKAVRDVSFYKYPLNPVRVIDSIRDMLDKSTELFAERTAFMVKKEHDKPFVHITYTELRRDVYALGTALCALGLKDKKIAIVAENRYEWAISYLATVCGTGTVVPLDKELTADELSSMLERAKASGVIYSNKMRKKYPELFVDNNNYLCINMDDDTPDVSIKQLIDKGNELLKQGKDEFVNSHPDIDDVNIILFTSGTTGRAKGVMLSHRNIVENLMNMLSMHYVNENNRFFSVLPLHHTYECTCGMLCPLYAGSSVVYCEGLKYIVKNMQESQPDYFLAVPQIVTSIYRQIWRGIDKQGKRKKVETAMKISNFLLKYHIDVRRKLFKEIHENLGGRMKMFISGAAALDPVIVEGMRAFGFMTVQGYGMTECSPIAAVNRDVYFDDASVGLPPIEVDAKIDNPSPDGIGEILLKGANVMVGYYEDEEETAKTIVDGWLHTGDMGYINDKGFIFITGRLKNVIVTENGENVYPEEIETLLDRSPYIAECMVYSETDKLGNQCEVRAHVFPDYKEVEAALGKDYSDADLEKLIDSEIKAVNDKISKFKRVQGFDIRHEDFVKTTTQKIKRYAN